MKSAFRQSMAWLHTWVGLLLGWCLYFMFLTGTLGYFDIEIDRWMRPEQPMVSRVAASQSVQAGLRRLREVAPDARRWFIVPPAGRDTPDLRIAWQGARSADGATAAGNELLDPRTGLPALGRATGGGQLLYRMHYELRYLPATAATWLVGLCTMFLLIAISTGVIVHKKLFKDFFTFRPARGQRSWLDAHNVLGVVCLPFHLMITYSGLLFFAATWMPLIVSASYGMGGANHEAYLEELAGLPAVTLERSGVPAPLFAPASIVAEAERRFGAGQVRFVEISNPGDAQARISVSRLPRGLLPDTERLTFDGVSGALLEARRPGRSATRAAHDALLDLHEGLFAGPMLRWLYFLAGSLGTAMIGTGLVLWTAKRSEHAKPPHWPAGLALVRRLNIGTLVGLPIGILTYFWANRLLPASFDERAEWECHAMFIAWGSMLVHAHLRPPAKAWTEQLAIAAGLSLLLPVVNALTTHRHLGVTIPHGEWMLAGVDLTILALGVLFAAAALKARSASNEAPRTSTRRRSAVPSPSAAQSGST